MPTGLEARDDPTSLDRVPLHVQTAFFVQTSSDCASKCSRKLLPKSGGRDLGRCEGGGLRLAVSLLKAVAGDFHPI